MTTKEIILLNLNKKIEELKKNNEKAMAAFVPCWTEIEHDRGMIDGIRFALEMMGQAEGVRDCENCKHHTENGCDSWDCQFEPQESEDKE